MKYLAYGMNTNLASMALRCPKARSLGRVVLPHYAFEFKRYATVVPEMNKQTMGVLWEITPECEANLDILEGYPSYYSKIIVWVEHNGQQVPAMTYLMHPEEELDYPTDKYWDMLVEGYQTHGISTDQLDWALVRVDSDYKSTKVTQDTTDYDIKKHTSW
jgi:gamma-glutamylcyclotransferase (GGCT)/AIG2-like uncharacterized protein YtfP